MSERLFTFCLTSWEKKKTVKVQNETEHIAHNTENNLSVLGLFPGQDLSVWSLHILLRVPSGYSGFLPKA